jgi:TPR repeat protein
LSPRSLLSSGLALLLLAVAPPAFAGEDEAESEEAPAFVVEKSPFDALELRCVEDQDAEACYEAGLGWAEGRGIESPNRGQAANLWTAGCSFGHGASCLAASRLYLSGQTGLLLYGSDWSMDYGEADRLLGLGCRLEVAEACGLRGDLNMAPTALYSADGPQMHHGLKPDTLLATQSFESGCLLTDDPPGGRDFRSCSRLGQMYGEGVGGVRKQPELGLRYQELACELAGPDSEACEAAERLDEEVADPDLEPRVSVQPHRPRPDTRRFQNPDVGIADRPVKEHYRRFEFELGLGARWTYGQRSLVGMKLRAGMNVWFNVIGIALETAFMTDRFAAVANRRYLRFQHALGLKTAFDVTVPNPWNARMWISLGAGGTLGSLKLHPADFVMAYGIREHIQWQIGTSQARGPRQWGAVRVEQQQTWHRGGGAAPEHSTQVVLIAGFTFGGLGPDWTPKDHGAE